MVVSNIWIINNLCSFKICLVSGIGHKAWTRFVPNVWSTYPCTYALINSKFTYVISDLHTANTDKHINDHYSKYYDNTFSILYVTCWV